MPRTDEIGTTEPRSDVVTSSVMEVLTNNEADIAFRHRVRTIMEWIPPATGTLVLDVPCGRGFYLHRYAYVNEHCTVVGLELDPTIIKRGHVALRGLNIPLARASVYELPLADGVFDGAICSELLEHLDDDVSALVELRRVLKPGGLVAITVPNADYPFWWDPINRTLQALTGSHVGRGPFAGIWAGHRRLYTRDQLNVAVSKAGLEVVDQRAFVHHCLPFSHNLVYGLGKPLIDHELLPKSIARAADRHAFRDTGPRWNPLAIAVRIAGWFDRHNLANEPVGVSTVNIAVLARRPFEPPLKR